MKNFVENQGIKTDKPLPMSYEALKAERDALAVESLGLRHIAERIVNNLYAAGYEPEENSIHPWKCLIFDAEKALNTPATDAALAAIEIRMLEKFSDSEHCSQEAHGCVCSYIDELREGK
ncbi:hypothetical protein [Serratia nevei]|uniref:hypothetical protein n=1 Tax=Serratia nevei TaxID=2703794 RepID=UPI0036929F67